MRLLLVLACAGAPPPAGSDAEDEPDPEPPADSAPPEETDPPDTDVPPPPSEITLPGDDFFPEGIGRAADGTLYVGSIGTGALAVAPPGASEATLLLEPGGFGAAGVMGVEVEDATGLVWFCTTDLRGNEISTVEAWDPSGPTRVHRFELMPTGFCNDLTFAPDGTLFVSDSDGGALLTVPPDRASIGPWYADPSLFNPGAFALNGIVAVGDAVYLGRFDTGEILRFDRDASGAASDPVVVASGLGAVDGLDAHGEVLIAADGPRNRLLRVDPVAGTFEVVTEDLDGPTTLEVDGDAAWVVEGQLTDLFGTPDLPFRVVRVPLTAR